jgi:uncharacterized membrane protein YsdA (DUF1294 family)
MAGRARSSSPYRFYTFLAVLLALAIVGALVWWLGIRIYVAWLLAMSIVTFAAYGFDKQRAVSDGGRVPELVLHGLALAGGVAGGWAGRAVFRHKTLQTSFTFVLVLATAIHAAVLVWLYANLWWT